MTPTMAIKYRDRGYVTFSKACHSKCDARSKGKRKIIAALGLGCSGWLQLWFERGMTQQVNFIVDQNRVLFLALVQAGNGLGDLAYQTTVIVPRLQAQFHCHLTEQVEPRACHPVQIRYLELNKVGLSPAMKTTRSGGFTGASNETCGMMIDQELRPCLDLVPCQRGERFLESGLSPHGAFLERGATSRASKSDPNVVAVSLCGSGQTSQLPVHCKEHARYRRASSAGQDMISGNPQAPIALSGNRQNGWVEVV